MDEIRELTTTIVKFRDERDWAQFHNLKDLALAINIEAGELLEVFLWKTPAEANREKIKEELADVFTFALLLANEMNIDVRQIVEQKLKANAEKYPIEKSKGTSKKYTDL
jgi:NTP pyrophosphatase (non-canonical NTP hydrolase)